MLCRPNSTIWVGYMKNDTHWMCANNARGCHLRTSAAKGYMRVICDFSRFIIQSFSVFSPDECNHRMSTTELETWMYQRSILGNSAYIPPSLYNRWGLTVMITRKIMYFLVYSLLHCHIVVTDFTSLYCHSKQCWSYRKHLHMYRCVYSNNNKGPIRWDI